MIDPQFLEWLSVICISFFVMNALILPYYHICSWVGIPKDINATSTIFNPGSIMINGDEGYSVRKVDQNGFLNPDERCKREQYVLVMGTSHSVGKEVPYGYNYVDLLEKYYHIPVYNMAIDGNYYPQLVKGFDAALQQFPKASTVIIEIHSTCANADELVDALQQRTYDEDYSGEHIKNHISIEDKALIVLREISPVIRAISKNIRIVIQQKMDSAKTNVKQDVPTEDNFDESQYVKALDDTFSLISSYDIPIIIIYHPQTKLHKDGTLEIIRSQTDLLFDNECRKYGIEFIDMGESFLNEYSENYRVPYGFMNTAMGSGHLNRIGHRLIAERLAKILED